MAKRTNIQTGPALSPLKTAITRRAQVEERLTRDIAALAGAQRNLAENERQRVAIQEQVELARAAIEHSTAALEEASNQVRQVAKRSQEPLGRALQTK